ncbi:MAG: hypothetical protein KatS3mg007_1832 [Thermoanaerobaculum sp.]|nr:MAG: hypothetical protein KatS3mg007_1832 [Thermoanaerobaculum sp.]
MTFYFIAAIIVLLLVWLFFWPSGRRRTKAVPIRQLRPHLEFLLRIAKEGSFLIFQDQKSSRFVQFRKASDGKEGDFLALDFPDAPWSRCYFEGVARALKQYGVRYAFAPTESLEIPRFLQVERIATVDEAQEIAELIFRELGLEEDAKVDVVLQVTGCQPLAGSGRH